MLFLWRIALVKKVHRVLLYITFFLVNSFLISNYIYSNSHEFICRCFTETFQNISLWLFVFIAILITGHWLFPQAEGYSGHIKTENQSHYSAELSFTLWNLQGFSAADDASGWTMGFKERELWEEEEEEEVMCTVQRLCRRPPGRTWKAKKERKANTHQLVSGSLRHIAMVIEQKQTVTRVWATNASSGHAPPPTSGQRSHFICP